MFCALETIRTSDIKTNTFNAVRLIQCFNIPLKPGLHLSQFQDEYLVFNEIPSLAICGSVTVLTLGEHEAALELPLTANTLKVARIPSVETPYWKSFNVIHLPETLYRVIYPGGKAIYNPREGLTTHSQAHPHEMSDREFKKSLQLQVNGDDELSNRRLHNMFMTYSNREAAISFAQACNKSRPRSGIAIAHIDGVKLGQSSSRWVYHAAYVIKELRIPLRNGISVQDFYYEYLHLHRIPLEAILEIENLTSDIPIGSQRPSVEENETNSSPAYIGTHTGYCVFGR